MALVSLKSRIPLYQSLATLLAKRIREGAWPVGSSLPSESILCRTYNASRHTLRHALQTLETSGLILRRQGAPTQVISRQVPRKFTFSFNSPVDILRYPRDTYRTNLVEEYIELDQTQSKLVGAAVHSSWYHIGGIRKQMGSDQIIAWTDIFILPKFASLTNDPDHSNSMVFEQIENKYGTQIDRAEVDVYATSATHQIASRLKIKEKDPCLVIIRRYYNANDELFESTITHHPQNLYTYSMEFRGSRNGDSL